MDFRILMSSTNDLRSALEALDALHTARRDAVAKVNDAKRLLAEIDEKIAFVVAWRRQLEQGDPPTRLQSDRAPAAVMRALESARRPMTATEIADQTPGGYAPATVRVALSRLCSRKAVERVSAGKYAVVRRPHAGHWAMTIDGPKNGIEALDHIEAERAANDSRETQ